MGQIVKYYIGLNSWHNINSSRIKFYNYLDHNFLENEVIDFEKIDEYKALNNTSKRFMDEELIGCLYAGFLTYNNCFKMTTRAKYDFKTFNLEAEYIENEVHLTIDTDENYIRFFSNYTSLDDEKDIGLYKYLGFSLNKNEFSFKKKYKHSDRSYRIILEDTKCLCDHFFSKASYYKKNGISDIINKYGSPRKTCHDLKCYINHKGFYDSDTFNEYKSVYLALIAFQKKPIDWGGVALRKEVLTTMAANNRFDLDKFISDAFDDGMLRKSDIDESLYTMTGKCSTICNSYLWKFYDKRISVIIFPCDREICLYIGMNSLYRPSFLNYLSEAGFSLEDCWMHKTFGIIDEAILALVKVLKKFCDR